MIRWLSTSLFVLIFVTGSSAREPTYTYARGNTDPTLKATYGQSPKLIWYRVEAATETQLLKGFSVRSDSGQTGQQLMTGTNIPFETHPRYPSLINRVFDLTNDSANRLGWYVLTGPRLEVRLLVTRRTVNLDLGPIPPAVLARKKFFQHQGFEAITLEPQQPYVAEEVRASLLSQPMLPRVRKKLLSQLRTLENKRVSPYLYLYYGTEFDPHD